MKPICFPLLSLKFPPHRPLADPPLPLPPPHSPTPTSSKGGRTLPLLDSTKLVTPSSLEAGEPVLGPFQLRLGHLCNSHTTPAPCLPCIYPEPPTPSSSADLKPHTELV